MPAGRVAGESRGIPTGRTVVSSRAGPSAPLPVRLAWRGQMKVGVMITDVQCGRIAQWYCASDYHRAARAGDVIPFHNIRAVERATWALAEAGLLLSPTPEGPRQWTLPVDAAAMPDFAARELDLTEEAKRGVLTQVIGFAGDVLDLPVTRRRFAAAERFAGLMAVMVDAGLAERDEVGYLWTERVAAAMRGAYFWDEEGFSVDDYDEQAPSGGDSRTWTLADLIRDVQEARGKSEGA